MKDISNFISRIENEREIPEVAQVLNALTERGLDEASVAGGFTRGFLTNTKPSDIDIAYVGDIHYEEARIILKDVLTELGLTNKDWDIDGIWNVSLAYPDIKTVEENYLIFYVDSIDTVYLAGDAKLHDPTGFGFEDAINKVLRMNNFLLNGYNYSPNDIVYFCLEGCRRIAKFGWVPTEKSIELIEYGIKFWNQLEEDQKEYYFSKKIKAKYQVNEYKPAQKIYSQYGWGFVFDKVINANN